MSDYENMTREELIDELHKARAMQDTLACPDGPEQLAHDLRTHQIELEMQNHELRVAQQHLEDARDRYADLYDFAPVGYITLDSKGVIREINLTGAAMLGRERSYLLGKPFYLWVTKDDLPAFYRHLMSVFASGSKETGEVMIKSHKDKLCNVNLESVAVARRGGDDRDCWMALIDITERKKYQQMQYLAYYDHLTGLPNRSLLEDRFNQAITAAQRNGTQLALMFLDMDRFKEVNDSLGHPAGDRLLQETAARLKNSVRKVDTVARLAGDEFIAIIPDLDGGTHAAVVAEHLLAALLPPFCIEGYELNLTHSIGISIFPDDGTDFQTLLKKADAAMYSAKKTGQHSFQFYTRDTHPGCRGLLHGKQHQERH